jgi:hypothetical protein
LASVGLLLFGDQGATRDFCCPSGTVSARRVSKLFDSFMDIWGPGLTVGGIKSKLSPVNLLGKLFFRLQAPWAQHRKMVILFWPITAGLILGGVVTAMILVDNTKH